MLCQHVPFGVNVNSSFIVDMNRLYNPRDILCDDMGVWKWNGSYRSWISVDEHGEVQIVGKNLAGSPSRMQYRIWKHSKSSPDVKKMVVLLEGWIQHRNLDNLDNYIGGQDVWVVRIDFKNSACAMLYYKVCFCRRNTLGTYEELGSSRHH